MQQHRTALGSGAVADVHDIEDLADAWRTYGVAVVREADLIDTAREAAGGNVDRLSALTSSVSSSLKERTEQLSDLLTRTESTFEVYKVNRGKILKALKEANAATDRALQDSKDALAAGDVDLAQRLQNQAEQSAANAEVADQLLEEYMNRWSSVLEAASDADTMPLLLAATRTAAALGQAGLHDSAEHLKKVIKDMERIEAKLRRIEETWPSDGEITDTLKTVAWVVGTAAALALVTTAVIAIVKR